MPRRTAAGFTGRAAITALAAVAGFGGLNGTALASPGSPALARSPADSHSTVAPPGPADLPPGVDHAHDTFQPGYLGGRTVVYRPGAPVQGAHVVPLFQVIYPAGWPDLTARPQCDYCDHVGNGLDADDFHDHVLTPPSPEANAAGKVTWHVSNVTPAYTGDGDHDRAVSAAYAHHLPAESVEEVQRLLEARLQDGKPIARLTDPGIEFGGPITSPF